MSELGQKFAAAVLDKVDIGDLLKKAIAENVTIEKVNEAIDKAFDLARVKAKELAAEQLAKLKA